jgi:hypothetical protein
VNATGADDPALLETSWPMPGADETDGADSLEWTLRYGEPTRSDLLAAADRLRAYRALICDSHTEQQQHRLAALRRVYRKRAKP